MRKSPENWGISNSKVASPLIPVFTIPDQIATKFTRPLFKGLTRFSIS